MDNKDSLQPVQEQEQSESSVNEALRKLQEKVRTGTKLERRQAARAFFDSLYKLPDQFRSLQLRIRLDTSDGRIEEYKEWLGSLGLSPLDGEGMVYDLQILTPRKTPMEGVTTTHGSRVRKRYFSVGQIGTVIEDSGYDPETNDNTTFLVNPTNIGILSVDDSFGKYWLFPRQIEHITLSTDLPSYLRPEQKALVDQLYSA